MPLPWTVCQIPLKLRLNGAREREFPTKPKEDLDRALGGTTNTYILYAALHEDIAEGFVWLKHEGLPQVAS